VNLTLFDLDGTLLPTDSDHAFGEFLVRWAGPTATSTAARNDPSMPTTWPAGWTSTPMSTSPPRPGAIAPGEDRLARDGRFLREVASSRRCTGALALVQRHRDAGDLAGHRHRHQRVRHAADRRRCSACRC
jgi:hypothetical protein